VVWNTRRARSRARYWSASSFPSARRGSSFTSTSFCPIDLTEFRSTWNNGEATTHRKHERMHSFFAFCVANDMLRKNPMDALKKPKTPDVVPTDYFLPEEFEQIVAATEKYEYGGGNDNEHRGQRLRALSLLMRWSGLAILDATSLERERLSTNENGDDQIFLYRAKTGVPVLSSSLTKWAMTLRQLPNSNPRYFFWSGNGDPRSAAKAFQRSYWKLFKLADIQKPDGTPKRCHPHMFRDTFAVELLLAGVPTGSSVFAVGAFQREDHGASLCALLQSSAGATCNFRQAGLEEADAIASQEERRRE
jgi:site-specific recombinase XerD